MAVGPGKYDALCQHVHKEAAVRSEIGGGTCVIVRHGNKGSGFSVIGDLRFMLILPEVLEAAARQIRADLSGTKQ